MPIFGMTRKPTARCSTTKASITAHGRRNHILTTRSAAKPQPNPRCPRSRPCPRISGFDCEDEDDDALLSAEETESWSDDPVRMYLTQMGEIPLLTRQQEIYLAKKIELTRRRFRTKLLECDYVIQQAYKVLKRVHDGELPFDRTVQVSVTDQLEKNQILGRLPGNLKTLTVLLKRYACARNRLRSELHLSPMFSRLEHRHDPKQQECRHQWLSVESLDIFSINLQV